MSKRRVVILFCIVLFVSIALAFEQQTQLAMRVLRLAQPTASETKAPTKQINAAQVATPLPEQKTEFISTYQKAEAPEYILYDQMFRLIVKFGKEAEEQQGKGEQPAPLRDYFQKQAKLDDEQMRVVQESAARFVEEVTIIDQQARVIIENIRSGIPKGQPLADKKILEPTAELKDLQNKREALALHYRDYLRDQLGADQFADFQNFVQQNMRQVITAIPVETLRPENAVDESKPLPRRHTN